MIPLALRYFLATVDCGSISAAAERLKVAPSAVSRMLKKLETEHRTALIERRPRGVIPTESGQILADYARRLLIDAERTSMDIADLRGVGKRNIAIAANQSFALELLPGLIREYQEEAPQLFFSLEVATSDAITQQVREGVVDVGVSYGIRQPDGVAILHAQRIPVLATMAADHPLADRSRLRLTDVIAYPIALMGPTSTLRAVIDKRAEAEQVTLRPTFTSNNVGALQAYCSSSNAIAFFGRSTVTDSIASGALAAIPLADGDVSLRDMYIQVMDGRALPASVMDFVDRLVARLSEDI
ncbi:LysR family transcriptional regulator [Nocardiopsis mangrovi]|uniref:LysR family transcriptional regulator n=1 Tax=Nocardiopsis mangrovi TaxID=1179818 RepID=A0ABV9DXG7_9ACTN